MIIFFSEYQLLPVFIKISIMSDDGVVAEKRNRGRAPKPNDVCIVMTCIMMYIFIRKLSNTYIVNYR